MFKSKYSNILTIVLIFAIIAIIAIVTILVHGEYKKYKNNKDSMIAIANFDNNVESITNETAEEKTGLVEQNVVIGSNDVPSSNKGTRKVTYYNGCVMIGYIEIPKIGIKYPVLEEETVLSLEQSVAVRYPQHPNLNEPGNITIVGHNYRNGMFFSNLKKVTIGDIVKITDAKGRTLTYTVYDLFETTPEDVEYMIRDVGNNTEISLVTCTDDGNSRLVLKAKV